MVLTEAVKGAFGFLAKIVRQGLEWGKSAATLVREGLVPSISEGLGALSDVAKAILKRPAEVEERVKTLPTLYDISPSPITLSDRFLVNYEITVRNRTTGQLEVKDFRLLFSEAQTFEDMLDAPYSVIGQSEDIEGVEIASIWTDEDTYHQWQQSVLWWA